MNDDIKTIREALEEAIAIDKRDNFDDPSLYTHQLEQAIAALDRLEAQQCGLTVDEAQECLVDHLAQYGADWSEKARHSLRARLTAKLQGK
jgi:hypothetical protein